MDDQVIPDFNRPVVVETVIPQAPRDPAPAAPVYVATPVVYAPPPRVEQPGRPPGDLKKPEANNPVTLSTSVVLGDPLAVQSTNLAPDISTYVSTNEPYFQLSSTVAPPQPPDTWYQYPSQSGSVIMDNTIPPQLITPSPGILHAFQQTIQYQGQSLMPSTWYLNPALNGEITLVDASGTQLLHSIDANLYYNNELLAKANDIQNIADWSLYPALATVDFNNFGITGASDLTSTTAHIGNIYAGGINATGGVDTGISGVICGGLNTNGTGPIVSGDVATSTVTASGAGTFGSITSNGIINAASHQVQNATAITIGPSAVGTLSSPDGALLTWNGQPVTTGGAGDVHNWSSYPALTDVSMNGFSIGAANNITATGSINSNTFTQVADPGGNPPLTLAAANASGLLVNSLSGGVATVASGAINTTSTGGNITTTAYSTINNVAGSNFNVSVDRGINPVSAAGVSINAKNGAGGLVSITADPAEITPVGGKISIVANGGQVTIPGDPPVTYTVGGEIDILANTGVGGLYTLTSAVKIAAAGVNSYAGAIPSVGSLAGYNFIYGTLGVNICAGVPSSGFQFPGTVYIYGVGSPGYAGVRIQSAGSGIQMLSDTYIENLYPLDGNGLTIQGRSLPTGYVTIKDVAALTMNSGAVITTDFVTSLSGNGIFYKDNLYPNTTSQGVYASFLKPIQATGPGAPNLLISGNAFLTNQNYVEIQNADVIAFDPAATGALTGVKSINGASWPPATGDASLWSQYPATSTVDMSGNGITNLASIGTLTNATITSAGSLGIFSDAADLSIAADNGGNVNIGTGNQGNISIQTTGAGHNLTLTGDTATINAAVGVVYTTPQVDFSQATLANVKDITGFTATPITVTSSSDIALEAANDAYVEAQAGSANLNGAIDVNLQALTGGVNITAPTVQINSATTVGTVAAPKDLTVNGNVRATADVFSNSTGVPVSLNTVGALVNGPQQYNYWVAPNGSDSTGTGSAIRPYATVGGALAATVSISDTIPVNICITAGTYTENPTVTRNNTFLVGNVGVADAVIIGTLTFTPTATAAVSQGATGISVVGSLVCSESISFDCSWYFQHCNISAFAAAALTANSTGSGNNSVFLYNTVITVNTIPNPGITLNSVRLNLIQSQISNTTTGSAITTSGTASMSLFGATLTCAGSSATASGIITFLNNVGNGTASSFQLCTFTYTSNTVGSGKCAVFFGNGGALAGATTFNQNVFTIPGSSSLILKPAIGAVAISWGTNTSSILTIPAASATLTYTYLTSTPLRANTLYDAAASAGTASQVLTAGSAGGSLAWSSLGASSLGALAATPAATAYQNQLVMFNTATNSLSYDSQAYGVQVGTAPSTIALATTQRGRIFILTSAGAQTVTFTTATLTANDTGFFVKVKNGNANGGGDLTIAGATGNTTVHNNTATATMGFAILYWTGSALVAY